jgi:hypothetical protein
MESAAASLWLWKTSSSWHLERKYVLGWLSHVGRDGSNQRSSMLALGA